MSPLFLGSSRTSTPTGLLWIIIMLVGGRLAARAYFLRTRCTPLHSKILNSSVGATIGRPFLTQRTSKALITRKQKRQERDLYRIGTDPSPLLFNSIIDRFYKLLHCRFVRYIGAYDQHRVFCSRDIQINFVRRCAVFFKCRSTRRGC